MFAILQLRPERVELLVSTTVEEKRVTSEEVADVADTDSPSSLLPAGMRVPTLTGLITLGTYRSPQPDQVFFAHLEGAEGDYPNAQHAVYTALAECNYAAGLIGLKGGLGKIRLAAPEIADELSGVVESCRKIAPAIPAGFTWRQFERKMLSAAAENGSAAAKLKQEWPIADLSEPAYRSIAANLERAVREGHYASFYLASDFIAGFHYPDGMDINFLEALKWQAVGCDKQSACNLDAFYHNLSIEMTPSELAQIKAFVSGFAERAADATPFGFADGWLPLYLYPEEGFDVFQ
ncbi:MAG: hypothetical protein AAF513_08115 [Pseudomonadota bacterium]